MQELLVPTAAGYLIDSSGAQAFAALLFACTLTNLCMFKPVLLYGARAQQALVKQGASNGDGEQETQGMIVELQAREGE